MKKNTLFALLRAGVSITLILILLYIMRSQYAQILAALKSARLSFLFASLILFFTALCIASLRFKLIVEAQGIIISFSEVISLTFIGYFFNNFFPTSIGGDVVKGYYLSRKAHDKMGSYTAVFVDRVIGMVTMIFMAFIALFFAGSRVIDDTARYIIYATTLFSVLLLIFAANKNFARKFSALLFFVRPVEEKLKKAYDAIHNYRHRTALVIQSLAISVISQLVYFLSIGILALSIGSRIPVMDILLRMPIISTMGLLPSINGLGVREGAIVILFGPLIGKGNAFAISILCLLVLFIASVAGGLIYALSPQFRVRLEKITQ